MPKLASLPRLKGLPAPRTRAPKLASEAKRVLKQKALTLDDELTPAGWQSWENFKAWQFTRKVDPAWQPQVKVGPDRIDVDLVHPRRGILWFLDGSWTHREQLQGVDAVKREGLKSQGWRVVSFRFTTRDDFMTRLNSWYDMEVG